MRAVAQGYSADGDRWSLTVGPGPEHVPRRFGAMAMVDVVDRHGRRWGGRGGGCRLLRGQLFGTCVGSADGGPRTFLIYVAPKVRAVVLTMSDGGREDLVLHRGEPELVGLRLGVLVHRRDVDIHRVDLFDHRGRPLGEPSLSRT